MWAIVYLRKLGCSQIVCCVRYRFVIILFSLFSFIDRTRNPFRAKLNELAIYYYYNNLLTKN